MGSLQAAQLGKQIEPMNPLVSEERVIFGLNAKAMSNLTLAKIRKVYSRADNKAIAKQLGMSSHENATPIRYAYVLTFFSQFNYHLIFVLFVVFYTILPVI